jgi:general secretion pathway protein E
MPTNFGEQLMEQPLTLASLALDLKADGRLSGKDLARVRNVSVGSIHPLVYLAEQKLDDPSRPGKALNMEALLAWLGKKSGQGVYPIDPLKINLGAITEVMSRAFAQRHRILAVEVGKEDVVIASGDPYIRAWEGTLEHELRKPIRMVLADPREIARHTAEFYTMAGSVRGAHGAGRSERAAAPTNLEAMLELGSMKEPDANDQHIVNIVFNMPSNSAPVISISNRAGKLPMCAFV